MPSGSPVEDMMRKTLIVALFLVSLPLWGQSGPPVWVTEGFEAFRQGEFGSSGTNLYVSRNGTLQTVHRFDVNGDNHYDLIFNNTHDRTHVLPSYQYHFEKGSRSNPARSEYYGAGAIGVGVQDLNGDGLAELVIARGDDNTTPAHNSWIYWGTPAGWSERYHQQIRTRDLQAFCIGDLNADQIPDLVFLAGPRGMGSRIYWGDKDGYSFSNFATFDTPPASGCLVADLDHDGRNDLFVAAKQSGVYWGAASGVQLGAFSAVAVANAVGAVPLGRRLAVATSDGPRIFSIRGRALVLDEEIQFAGSGRLAAADLNADGVTDLVVARAVDGTKWETTSRVYWGRKAGTAETYRGGRVTELPTRGAADVAVGDIDGDGFPDIVFANEKDQEKYETPSYIYWGGGSGYGPARRTELPTLGAASVAVRGSDVVFGNRLKARRQGDVDSFIYLGSADGTYSQDRRINLPTIGAYESCPADFNDDGFVDVLIVNSHEDDKHAGAGSFLYWGGKDGFSAKQRTALPSRAGIGCAVADVNRDGFLDVLIANLADDTVSLFFGGPDHFRSPREQVLKALDARFPLIADVNKDGWLDLVIPSVKKGMYVFWGSSHGYSENNVQILPGIGTVSTQIADLDANGWLDIIACNLYDEPTVTYHGVNTYIYWGSEQGFSPLRRMDLPSLGSEHATVADFNRDGFLDIFISNYASEFTRDLDSYIYWGSANGFSSTNRKPLHIGSASGANTGDFNGDGWIDLAVANHFGNGSHVTESPVFINGPQGFDNNRKIMLPTIGAHMMNGVDPGDIYTRAFREVYTSAVYRMEDAFAPVALTWEGATPFDSKLKFELRGADTPVALEKAQWVPVGTVSEAEKNAKLSGHGRHTLWQYQVTFVEGRACSPSLRRVEIRFER